MQSTKTEKILKYGLSILALIAFVFPPKVTAVTKRRKVNKEFSEGNARFERTEDVGSNKWNSDRCVKAFFYSSYPFFKAIDLSLTFFERWREYKRTRDFWGDLIKGERALMFSISSNKN